LVGALGQLLEEAVNPFLEDLKRRRDLGLEAEALGWRALPGLRLEVAKILPRPGPSSASSLERVCSSSPDETTSEAPSPIEGRRTLEKGREL
jgi:hypothetical protein